MRLDKEIDTLLKPIKYNALVEPKMNLFQSNFRRHLYFCLGDFYVVTRVSLCLTETISTAIAKTTHTK